MKVGKIQHKQGLVQQVTVQFQKRDFVKVVVVAAAFNVASAFLTGVIKEAARIRS